MNDFIKAFSGCLIFFGTCNACGYKDCPPISDSLINLHIVPHSHDDVGWLKTVDQYYYGVKNEIQDAGVQYILDTVVYELIKDPKKRFIYVETAFFWKWWSEQSDFIKHQVKVLVNNGQLEFIGGAWSMNDEATTHYQSIIDQFTLGLRRLKQAFGECGRPKVGWQIDPFGHSRENAGIMARIGFDGLFLGRIDWQDKSYRLQNKTMEMVWHTSANDKSEKASLFTGVLYNAYSAPKGFCFDVNCHDEPIIDNPLSSEYNANRRVGEFLKKMTDYAKAYKTNNILITMGDDFMYMNAHMYYKNLDKLIRHINEISGPNSPFKAFYSTPSCYLKAVHDTGVELPVKNDDFFPYSSDPNAFWTGYFTSRATIKRFERIGNNYLQVAKQLVVLSHLRHSFKRDLNAFSEAMGIMQHHDAITGTEKQQVANDYAKILTKAFVSGETITYHALGQLSTPANKLPPLFQSCLLLNISSCDVSESENKFVVTIYNPLSRPVSKPIRIPIKDKNQRYSVKCPLGKEQLVQNIPLSPAIQAIPGRPGDATAELVFVAKDLPPLGYRSYYVSKVHGERARSSKVLRPLLLPVVIGFDNSVKITVTPLGNVKSITTKEGIMHLVSNSLKYYIGAIGDNEEFKNRSSGAYIFRPNSSAIDINTTPNTIVIKGPVLNEVHIKYNDWASQIVRVYSGSSDVEFHWLVGPIPIEDKQGKEIIAVYKFKNLHNNGEFTTDSNGREALPRKINYRETWPVTLSEPVSGNYYPVTTRISIKDGDKAAHVITDRSQGGSSLNDGEIELMVHRRLLHDDAFGVGEALNETAYGSGLVAIGSHILSLENDGHARKVMQEQVLSPWIFFSPAKGYDFNGWSSTFKMEFSGLQNALPDNVQILTLEPWTEDEVLLRLEHICEKDDDPDLSKPVEIDLNAIFSEFKIVTVKETLLGANYNVGELTRLKWKTNSINQPEVNVSSNVDKVLLQPMDIRSFIIKLSSL